jgi:hypothetical protein
MVAGDRSGFYHLQESSELIEMGNWQIALKTAISDYLPPMTPPTASNAGGTVSVSTRAKGC